MTYYAVIKGFKTGLFDNWGECREAVNGYSNAVYKSFDKLGDACLFLKAHNTSFKLPGRQRSLLSYKLAAS